VMAEESPKVVAARFYGAFRSENDDVNEFADDVAFSISTSHKSANGVSVATTAESKKDKDGKQAPLVASVSPSFTFAEHDLTANFALNQKIAKSSERFRLASLEAGVEKGNPFGLEGSNLGGGLVYKQKNLSHSWLAKGNFDFSNQLFAAQLDGTYEVGKGVTDGSVSAAFTHSNVSVGGVWNRTSDSEPGSKKDDDEPPRFAVGLAYHQDKYSAQLNGAVFDEKRIVDVDVWHNCSDKDQWTLNIAGKLDKDNKYKNTKVAVGALHEFDDDTNLKVQVATKIAEAKTARLNVAFSRKLTPNVSTTVGANINALHLIGRDAGGKGHSLGLQVEIE